MTYHAKVIAINGAKLKIEFDGDTKELARDHIRQLAGDADSSFWDSKPEGEAWVRFRRDNAKNWIDAGRVEVR